MPSDLCDTYLSPLLHQVSGYGDTEVALVLMLFGMGSAIGSLWGGLGPVRVVQRTLLGVFVLFCMVSVVATWVPRPVATVAILAIVAAWGVVGWSFPPAQQLSLVRSAPALAPVVLSLNGSAVYPGVSAGAVGLVRGGVEAHRAHRLSWGRRACWLRCSCRGLQRAGDGVGCAVGRYSLSAPGRAIGISLNCGGLGRAGAVAIAACRAAGQRSMRSHALISVCNEDREHQVAQLVNPHYLRSTVLSTALAPCVSTATFV